MTAVQDVSWIKPDDQAPEAFNGSKNIWLSCIFFFLSLFLIPVNRLVYLKYKFNEIKFILTMIQLKYLFVAE